MSNRADSVNMKRFPVACGELLRIIGPVRQLRITFSQSHFMLIIPGSELRSDARRLLTIQRLVSGQLLYLSAL